MYLYYYVLNFNVFLFCRGKDDTFIFLFYLRWELRKRYLEKIMIMNEDIIMF